MNYAHSARQNDKRHPLTDHLRSTAHQARLFADAFGAGDMAYYVGLWHDLGKFSPAFQDYLLRCESTPSARGHGPDHKAAGAQLASLRLPGPLALLIQGHHGGLKTKPDLDHLLAQQSKGTALQDALNRARQELPDLEPPVPPEPPEHTRSNPWAAELFLRMLFSTLVDADYLDTEQHYNPERSTRRGSEVTIAQLWERFQCDQERFRNSIGVVNQARREIYQACLEAATNPIGMFRLTVPTGGGKTRSAMAFALRHALHHGHRRVIVALPFITITDQTAQVYRGIFQSSDEDYHVLLEHHSGVTTWEDDRGDDFHPRQVWARLAAENWDAPIVVTTTVQLFQSLFSNMPGQTRKLHRLARSVVILDEAQALPPHLLRPILNVLRDLCQHYGTTVVLSTATQPAFEAIRDFADLPSVEIVENPSRYFHGLRRVAYEWHTDTDMTWRDVASLMREEDQSLAVVNTKKNALALLDALDDPRALHLSTLLCGAHRQWVIQEVKRRLEAGEPCHLVSTQVVEAGVDLDFPLVLRALGPLDGIIQSAGRCNREGKLEKGRVVIFKPTEGGMPLGVYRTATDITAAMLNAANIDMNDPAVPREYFQKLFHSIETDRKQIQESRKNLNYPRVAEKFRMIDNATESVVITSYGTSAQPSGARGLVMQLRNGAPNARDTLRRLRPYMVSIYRGQAPQQLLSELIPGVYEWMGDYDPVRGIGGVTSIDPDRLVL